MIVLVISHYGFENMILALIENVSGHSLLFTVIKDMIVTI